MHKLDPRPKTLSMTIDPASQSDASTPPNMNPCPTRRLIVLIPIDTDYGAATRRIWELAHATGMCVLLLGLCKDVAQEPSLRRGLVTVSALIRDGRVPVEAKVEVGTNWVDAVTRNYQRDDMIVCFAEQRAGLLHKPLSQILESRFDAPVYILSGVYPPQHERLNWVSQFLAWTGSIGIIVVFFLLQIRITSLPRDWAQTTLLILSVIGETWLIWGWNSLFS